jgi:hypothetical protein
VDKRTENTAIRRRHHSGRQHSFGVLRCVRLKNFIESNAFQNRNIGNVIDTLSNLTRFNETTLSKMESCEPNCTAPFHRDRPNLMAL